MNRLVGIKNYGFDWYTTFGLSETAAAAKLRDQGVDWVCVQNLHDPLPGSAVAQAPPPASYSDGRFRDALRDAGIKIFESTACFFQPDAYASRPDLRPIATDGSVMAPYGWYVGICPSDPDYLRERSELMERVVADLQPDGIFLVFIRFPGFWELWMPETPRSAIAEYCFCDRCLERFQTELGIELPLRPRPELATLLQTELRREWTAWKTSVIAQTVAALRAAGARARPNLEVLINTVGFGRTDYSDARREVLGQDLPSISAATAFELMFYHQIQRRDPGPWIESVCAEARSETSAAILACLQTKPAYLEPLYRAGRRNPTIPIEEHEDALRAVTRSAADGAMVYLWSDYLEDEAVGTGDLTRALRRFKDGEL